ncbi:uncharacterized protein VTP21DRAFT_7577 [Calcarisporiella thermophila]|uniref:uncharacterized protein n=1 Tax=Calcarisporiella thermophila TaxID=911321 RepID=UPI00374363FB
MTQNTEPAAHIDWNNLGFKYIDTNGHIRHVWRDGKWNEGELVPEAYIRTHICSPALNYAQECFEGLKAFRCKDGKVRIFRPDANAKRLQQSAEAVMLPHVPEDLFISAVKRAVAANIEYVPPYGSGGSLYIRPLLIGTGPQISLEPSDEAMLLVFVMPVAPYYRGGITPVDAEIIENFDRTAPHGTGCYKLGGNYAPVFRHCLDAKKRGFPITLHLDSKTRSFIDEFSTSNFIGLEKTPSGDVIFSTPDAPTILRSITRESLCQLAESFGWQVKKRSIPLEELREGRFIEVAACGTAAIITPVRKFVRGQEEILVNGGAKECGPLLRKLYDRFRAIQNGEEEDKFGWLVQV